MRWRQRLFEKRMSRSLDYSWLDHTLFIHFLYLLITFLFYIYIYFSLASEWDKSDWWSGPAFRCNKKARPSSLMKRTISTVEGLLEIAVQMFILETLGSSCRWFKQMFQPFQTFSNIFIQPWFCPDVEYRAHHRRISETHTGFAPAFCDSKISKRRDIRLI